MNREFKAQMGWAMNFVTFSFEKDTHEFDVLTIAMGNLLSQLLVGILTYS